MNEMNRSIAEMVALVEAELAARADPAKAGPMQAYMKTTQPFHGVQKPDRVPLVRRLKEFAPKDRRDWERRTLALWNLPHREERYVALDYAMLWRAYRTPEALGFLRRLIVEGAWWDLVDVVAGGLVSPILKAHRAETKPVMEQWIEDEDLWVRRAALLSQLKHKGETDEAQLFDFCLRRAGEKDFFIRKAIGWALRDYSWTRPEAVRDFVVSCHGKLSPLSVREACKQLRKMGLTVE